MNEQKDKAAFFEGLATLAESLQSPGLSEKVADAYYRHLADIDIDRVLQTMDTLIGTAKFFPKPVEIREAAGIANSPQAIEAKAYTAWIELRSNNRARMDAALDDPCAAAAFKALRGYRNVILTITGQIPGRAIFGDWDLKNEHWKQREFCAYYAEMCAQAQRAPVALPPSPAEATALLQTYAMLGRARLRNGYPTGEPTT